ncbi:nicotinate-nucleotide adenylyltransferase [Lutibacter citreus]|uniref:nicotinate-nucleotide adenylyltransferase n=1 Tax=Lutibacter citreus TaxID=2138210 RepID=UPI000DBE4747|nr:nicotinate-nucleotide adenylyltransferase [Lutibacter citreus]
MKKLIIGLIIFGFAIQTQAQVITRDEELSEVVITALNYKYLSELGVEKTSFPVSVLEQKAASFDLINSKYYNEEYDTFAISFFIPQGKILAVYNKNGDILKTTEKYRGVKIPRETLNLIGETYPNWSITNNVYLANYDDSGKITKTFKIILENNGKRIKVFTDNEGNII